MGKLLFLFGVILFAASANARLIDLEPLGESYPIAESNLMEEIAARLKNIDIQALKDKYFEESFRRAMTVSLELPPAPKDEVRRITPAHILEQEMFTIDKAGVKHVSYPKGFIFNPLEYMKLDREYIFINAGREVEIKWLLSRELSPAAMVIVSEGDLIDVRQRLNRKVYALSGLLKDKFFVRYTPSYARQEGNQIAVYEYFLERPDETH
jgi:conjugal transfer pilus assembly protein TraW